MTPTAVLLGIEIQSIKGNFDALSTASKIYSLPTKGVAPIRSKSTCSTSHGLTARAGKRKNCSLMPVLRLRHPQDRTYSRTSLTTVD